MLSQNDPGTSQPKRSLRRILFGILLIVPPLLLSASMVQRAIRGPRPAGHRSGQSPSGPRPELHLLTTVSTNTTPINPVPSNATSTNPNNIESTQPSSTPVAETESITWSRFRGPNGSGISSDESIPTQWDESQNIKWSTPLPGPGSSSPILTDQLVFVTCYKGINSESRQADTKDLSRSVVCLSRQDGKILWQHNEPAVQPEDRYQGMGVPEHGYATNTPVTDGQKVFAFLGKSGVLAFDLQGNKLWQTSVGTQSGNRGWGTASSLILYQDLVIVNASEESQTILRPSHFRWPRGLEGYRLSSRNGV